LRAGESGKRENRERAANLDTVVLFGVGLVVVFAALAFVSYWFGWRFVSMMFTSTTVTCVTATIVYATGLPKMVTTIVTAIVCSILLNRIVAGQAPSKSPRERWLENRAEHKAERERMERDAEVALVREAATAGEATAGEAGDSWERELDAALHK